MQALVYPAKGEIAISQRSVPRPGPGEALVRIAASGICHTDIDVLHARYGSGAFPVVPGHEFAGTVEAIEGDADGVSGGTRVVVDPNLPCGSCRPCRRGLGNLCVRLGAYGVSRDGGFADYAIVATEKLRPIGAMPFALAALAEPLACVLNGLGQAGTTGVERGLVFGAGPIGLLMALALREHGVDSVAVADRNETRLGLAEGLGLTPYAAGSDALLSERRSFDLVADATGVAQVAESLLDFAADGGTALVFGVAAPDATITLSPFQIFRRQLRLVGSHSLNGNITEALDLLAARPDAFARLVSDRVPLSDIPAFLKGETKGAMKVQFDAGTDA